MVQEMKLTETILLLFTSMLGSGIIFIPIAFKSAGYLGGLINLLILAILISFSLIVISYGVRKLENDELSLFHLCRKAHPIFGYLSAMSISILGIVSCFLVISLSVSWLSKIMNITEKLYSVLLKIFISIPLFYISAQNSLSRLKYVAYISMFAITYFIFLTFSAFYTTKGLNIKTSPINSDIGIATSKFMFSLCVHSNFVPAFGALRNKSTKNILVISFCTILMGTIIYALIGLLGYFAIGDDCQSMDFLSALLDKNTKVNQYLSINDRSILIDFGCLSFILLLLASFPFQAIPSRNSLMKIFIFIFKINNSCRYEKIYRIGFTFLVTLLSLSIAIYDPDINFLINIIGAVFINLYCLFLPSISYIFTHKTKNIVYAISIFLIIFSIGLMTYMLYNIIIKD
ncbi:Transmembrane amino acid transporter [Spraguea lophii 42_110]|uniref:Transmembrane amino acid transporter n=1 Tax=Spraguea lophii (strain 42_110) TaxID=1358809 RepID=S7XVF8_SPRLO|nr:Transmembrane amino acid transporter [Spraguea lophii 42_110]